MKKEILLQRLSLIIKEKRIEMGLSQEKFAFKIGIDRKYASMIEKGNVNISILILNKVCKGLNILLSEFLKEVENIN